MQVWAHKVMLLVLHRRRHESLAQQKLQIFSSFCKKMRMKIPFFLCSCVVQCHPLHFNLILLLIRQCDKNRGELQLERWKELTAKKQQTRIINFTRIFFHLTRPYCVRSLWWKSFSFEMAECAYTFSDIKCVFILLKNWYHISFIWRRSEMKTTFS